MSGFRAAPVCSKDDADDTKIAELDFQAFLWRGQTSDGERTGIFSRSLFRPAFFSSRQGQPEETNLRNDRPIKAVAIICCRSVPEIDRGVGADEIRELQALRGGRRNNHFPQLVAAIRAGAQRRCHLLFPQNRAVLRPGRIGMREIQIVMQPPAFGLLRAADDQFRHRGDVAQLQQVARHDEIPIILLDSPANWQYASRRARRQALRRVSTPAWAP